MDDADRIWNRSCDPGYRPTRRGDVALHAILSFHSPSMNGGVADPLETDFSLATAAIDGYRMLGAPQLAQVLEEARAVAAPALDAQGSFDILRLDEHGQKTLDVLNDRLPDDEAVESIFRRYLAEHPEDFDPA